MEEKDLLRVLDYTASVLDKSERLLRGERFDYSLNSFRILFNFDLYASMVCSLGKSDRLLLDYIIKNMTVRNLLAKKVIFDYDLSYEVCRRCIIVLITNSFIYDFGGYIFFNPYIAINVKGKKEFSKMRAEWDALR
jgi:hypothetical protein